MDGYTVNQDTRENQWVNRRVDLSPWAGQQLVMVSMQKDVWTGPGAWSMWESDLAISSTDGTVTQIPLSELVGTAGCQGQSDYIASEVQPAGTAPGLAGSGADTHFYLGDHLGTAQLELSSGGWPLWQRQFAPYGAELKNGLLLDPTAADGSQNHYKFTGKERDAESGLDYFGARYYASSMGRWMSPDWADKPEAVPYSVLGDPQSLNLYGYVRNNPLGTADPDGHCPWCEVLTEIAESPAGQAAERAAGQVFAATAGAAIAIGAKASGALDKIADGIAANPGSIQSGSWDIGGNYNHAELSSSHPEIVIDGNQHPESAQHAADAQAAGKPADVTIDRGGKDGRRADALGGTSAVPGAHRDEYPPAVTAEGGKGASVRPISPSDNSGAGASMGNQMRRYPDGTKVTIKPINVPKPPHQ